MPTIRPGDRVRMTRSWLVNKDKTGQGDVCVEGTVAEFTDLGDGTGALLLRDVPTGSEGWWRAPSRDAQQITTVDVL